MSNKVMMRAGLLATVALVFIAPPVSAQGKRGANRAPAVAAAAAPAPVAAPFQVSHGVAIGKAVFVEVERPFAEVVLPRPDVANVQVLTERSFYVYGKQAGVTNILLFDRAKRLVGSVDINIGFDVAGLSGALRQSLPEETINIMSTPNGIVLRGVVSSPTAVAEALGVAERFAPGAVTNALVVRGPQQVLLEVRFLEATRSIGRELGIDTIYNDLRDVVVATGSGLTDAAAAAASTTIPGAVGALTGQTAGGAAVARTFMGDALASGERGVGRSSIRSGDFYVELDSLERSGVVRTLARPNIAALSGDTASFLAGGEFPIPVAAENNRITVEFKEYGVALAFTPTVLNDGKINLKIASEVSQLDRNNSLRVAQIELPALTVRRATTTVELKSGEAMAMAGLLQSSYLNQKTQVPWAGDVPVLGTLFRSTRFLRGETELIVVVIPRLVAPVSDVNALRNPLDARAEPSDAELFLNGLIDKARTAPSPVSQTNAGSAKSN